MGNILSKPDEQRHMDEGMPKHSEDRPEDPSVTLKREPPPSRDKSNVGKRVGRQRLEELNVRVKELTVSLDALSHESRARMQSQEEKLRQTTADFEVREARSNRELRDANANIRGLQSRLAAAEHRNRHLESIVASTQESALDSIIADKGYTPMEDQVVRDKLDKLGEGIRNWARKHSAASLDECASITSKDKDSIVKELRGYAPQENWEQLIENIPFSPTKIPLLFVQALLVKCIFGRLFRHPFFAFDNMDGKKNIPQPEEMMELYRIMLHVNGADGHIWRSQTLRGLFRSTGDANPSFLQERIGLLSKNFATEFVVGLAASLLRPIGADQAGAFRTRERELQELHNGAARLALSLWMQRSLIVCLSEADVPMFNVSNPVLKAHRLHHLDEDDHKLDGKKIALFIQPAVLAFGSEEAEHYDKYKVWAPAVVVVGGER